MFFSLIKAIKIAILTHILLTKKLRFEKNETFMNTNYSGIEMWHNISLKG